MGRRKIEIQAIKDERVRRVTFKKRRIGLLKKAVQLSLLTNVVVEMKVYNKEDNSLVEYFSSGKEELKDTVNDLPTIRQYAKFNNSHLDLVQLLEETITKHGNLNCLQEIECFDFETMLDKLEGFNKLQLFSHAKKLMQQVPL